MPKTIRSDIEAKVIKPQEGPQEQILATSADIAVYGGAAWAGKSYALLMEALRHINNPHFGAVIFRRTYPQIKNQGGLWDTSMEIYPLAGGIPREGDLDWTFPSGCRVNFAHMQHEQDRYQWDGAQIPYIGFDQLEHFSWRQFWYLVGRNRSMCGVRPYIRATCNPNPDHWLRSFMGWWIDEETGYPIRARSGIIRWFVIKDDAPDWADDPKELIKRHGSKTVPKSFTFIPGSVTDNKLGLEKNPEYMGNLQSLFHVDRLRLLEGNWNARESAGMFFQRGWFEIVSASPALIDTVRYWDLAASDDPKASWTANVQMGQAANGLFYITDVVRFQGSSHAVEEQLKNLTIQDGHGITVGIEQDPGQAGKAQAEAIARMLAGYDVQINPVRESKGLRCRPFSAQAEAGNVKLVAGSWNEPYLRELENFDASPGCVADQVDASSGAFFILTSMRKAGTWGRR